MDLSLYPPGWKATALETKEQANWICQECGRPCRLPGESTLELYERINNQHPQWASDLVDDEGNSKFGRFVLTAAHLDHDPWNANARLKAMCSPCHGRNDLKAKATKRRLKRERLGQLSLLSDLAGKGKDAMRVQKVLFAGDA
jgi:hypothetical protein